MAYTTFGEYVRILRIKHHQVMGDLAQILGVSVPFLSAVENGKKNVPLEWHEIITDYYNLTASESSELEEAINESKTQYKINACNASATQRQAAMVFAREFEDMDDDTAYKILNLLNKKKETKE